MSSRFHWTTRAIGVFVATVASLGVLTLAIQGAPLERIAQLIPAILAGMLLIEIHWVLAIPLAAIAVVYAVRDITLPFAHTRDDSASAEPDRPT